MLPHSLWSTSSSRVRAAVTATLCRHYRPGLHPKPRTTQQAACYGSALGNDPPKPFLNTKAHKQKVEDPYVLTEDEQKRGRYALPLGFSLFAFVMYFAFIREYDDDDKSVVDFLTKDISDKVPPHKMARIKQQLKEEEDLYKLLASEGEMRKEKSPKRSQDTG